MKWHLLSREQIFEQLGSSEEGLPEALALERLLSNGPNDIITKKKKPLWFKFLHQLKDVMILVLIAAATLAAIMKDYTDCIIIIIIVLVNALIGFIQEYRVENAIEALKSMSAANAIVRRTREKKVVPASALVPGDIVVLEAGQIVPADLRLLEAQGLKLQEATLTGESEDVEKHNQTLYDEEASLADRKNMAYKGTVVSAGRGCGIVVSTGMETEMGKIASILTGEENTTPLQKRMAEFGKTISLIVLAIGFVVFITGFLRGEEPLRLLLTSISLAVAAIPESLPAVITISLALGARRMVESKALIRKLPAVETLGSVTYICSDKTGTLTQNRMVVEKTEIFKTENGDDELFYLNLSLNNDVELSNAKLVGDSTEIALYEYAEGRMFVKEALLKKYPRVAEIPFDAERKLMSTLHTYGSRYLLLVKGAVESLLEKVGGAKEQEILAVHQKAELLSSKGYRVLAHAYRFIDDFSLPLLPIQLEQQLTILGLTGLVDPVRPEVIKAVSDCYSAGIQPVMITGDHLETARYIACEVGILKEGEADQQSIAITGKELENLSEETFRVEVENIKVYARVSPQQKLDIVKALQGRGQFVAMTGDGINDAPALKNADIGVAMGITGTDVAKEAAHMILLDDNFATIATAIKEGRRIYDNIRKFIKYTFTSNVGEVLTIFIAPLVGLPIPLLPVHILWINLVTDGLPGLALSYEKAEKDVMLRPPRASNESVFSKGMGSHVIWVGLLMAAVTLSVQAFTYGRNNPHWQTIVFNVLCLSQMGHVLAVRSEQTVFSLNFFSNKPLVAAVLLTLFLQLLVTFVPIFQPIFHTQTLSIVEIVLVGAFSLIVFLVVELEKLFRGRKN